MWRLNWVIGCQKGREVLKRYLQAEAEYLESLDIQTELTETQSGTSWFVDCTFKHNGNGEPAALVKICRRQLAAAVARTIVAVWEPFLIRKTLEYNYSYLESGERAQICRRAQRLAADRRRQGQLFAAAGQAAAGSGQPDGEILVRVQEHLREYRYLNLEGFVTFRLGDYVEGLYRLVDESVEEFVSEREYREFVRLLRYFVAVQEPRTRWVQLFIKPGEIFEVRDDAGNAMDDQYLRNLVEQLTDTEVSHADLLVSILITLAPEKITLHCPSERLEEEAVRTVRDVFYRRVKVCTGCSECSELYAEYSRHDG